MSFLSPVGSSLAACCSSSQAHRFPLSSLFGEVVLVAVATMQLAVAATLDTSQDLSMDCLSCSRGCAQGGWGLVRLWHMRPAMVLTPTGFVPWA
jgi:hypothetical protein